MNGVFSRKEKIQVKNKANWSQRKEKQSEMKKNRIVWFKKNKDREIKNNV